MFSGKTIFISPLDWGLGHATRCVPLIRSLSEKNTVILGTTSRNRIFFDTCFPALEKIDLPSYNIRYSATLPVWLKVLLQAPKIGSVIRRERKIIEQLVGSRSIDVVISDNRFGLHTAGATCVFMTHQLRIKAPFFSWAANYINRKFIHRFDAVWVPDHEEKDRRLSGELSDATRIKIPVRYIGPLSYVAEFSAQTKPSEKIDCLLLLSGIEPQRSLLEEALLAKFKHPDKKMVLVRGTPTGEKLEDASVHSISFAEGEELCQLIVNAETVICRSGYSTLMDLHALGKKKIILIPTPGQTEQEYLARLWEKKFKVTYWRQNRIQHVNFQI